MSEQKQLSDSDAWTPKEVIKLLADAAKVCIIGAAGPGGQKRATTAIRYLDQNRFDPGWETQRQVLMLCVSHAAGHLTLQELEDWRP